jgi:hypothetical protein
MKDGPIDPPPAPGSPAEPLPPAARPPGPRPSSRAEIAATLALLAGLGGFLAYRAVARRLAPHPRPDQCLLLLDRYAEHNLRADDPQASASALDAARRFARARADPTMARCSDELTMSELDCAMKATNADEVERCLP